MEGNLYPFVLKQQIHELGVKTRKNMQKGETHWGFAFVVVVPLGLEPRTY